MSPIVEDRLSLLDTLVLKRSSHAEAEKEFCVMEAVAYVAGEPWSDAPQCACPVITSFMVNWNDSLPNDEERTRLLKPLIPKIVGTRSTPEVQFARSMMCMDWLCREFVPAWLMLTPSLVPHAEVLRAAKPIQNWDDVRAIVSDLNAADSAAYSAADSAADSAAYSAARSAAYSAAYSALKPTTEALQLSAVALVERMCAVK